MTFPLGGIPLSVTCPIARAPKQTRKSSDWSLLSQAEYRIGTKSQRRSALLAARLILADAGWSYAYDAVSQSTYRVAASRRGSPARRKKSICTSAVNPVPRPRLVLALYAAEMRPRVSVTKVFG